MGKGKLLKYRDQERPHGKITLKKKKKKLKEGREQIMRISGRRAFQQSEQYVQRPWGRRMLVTFVK